MGGFRRRAPRPAFVGVVAWLLLHATAVRAVFSNDFSAYPANTRGCLQAASDDSACDGDDVTAMNACLCGNGGGFITSTAQCVGRADYADLSAVYSTMTAACDYTKTPIQVTESDFMATGAKGRDDVATTTGSTTAGSTTTTSTHGTTTTPSTTTTATTLSTTTSAASSHSVTKTTTTAADATPTHNASGDDNNDNNNNNGGGGGGLSKAQRTTVIVGASVGTVALLAAAAALVLWCQRRRQRASSDEKRPMLLDHAGAAGGAAPISHQSLTSTELSHLSSPAFGGGGGVSDMHDPCPSDAVPWSASSYVSVASTNTPSELPGRQYADPVEMPATAAAHGDGRYDGHSWGTAPYTPIPPPPQPRGWQSTAYR